MRVRSILLLVLCLASCTEVPVAAPTGAQKVANGIALRALPGQVDVAVGAKATPRAMFVESEELVATLALEGHAKIADETVASLVGGVVVGNAPGATTMHIENEQPLEGAVDVPIVVHAAPPTELVIEALPMMRIGESVPLKATAHWAEGTSDATYDVEWSSDGLALVDTAARSVAALSENPSKLSAKLGTLAVSTSVTPSGKPPVAIEIHVAWSWLDQRRFGAFARYEDGEVREVSAACAWTTEGKPWSSPVSIGPRVQAAALSWDKIATCTVAGVKGSGSLFGE